MEAEYDKIHITDLRIRCIIGINPKERIEEQDLVFNITLYGDLSRACRSDNIDDTVNYKTLKDRIVAYIRHSKFYLIEKAAEEVAAICLSDSMVKKVTVRVDKPGALTYAASVSVEITRYAE
ncbi:MAG: dihydroneopterin aldolase [Spirochaetales bacterium]|nr:dihydroneopterin aldolase [Spirochaetales bacterium]